MSEVYIAVYYCGCKSRQYLNWEDVPLRCRAHDLGMASFHLTVRHTKEPKPPQPASAYPVAYMKKG